MGALLCVPAWMLFMLIGTMVWAYYQLSGEALPPQFTKADKIFPHFLATKIPAGLAGLFMASLLSAAMSMLSSDLNCLSVVGVEDYYRKLRPEASDRQRLLAGKLAVAGCGLVAVLVAILIAYYSNRILSFYYMVTSIIAAGLAGLFLLAFLSPRANRQGAYVGVAACLAFTAWGTLTSGSPKFAETSFDDYGGLVAKLQAASEPRAACLRQELSERTRELLAGRDAAQDPALQSALVKDLNMVLGKDSFWQEKAFAEVKLSGPARDLSGKSSRTEEETRRLNRLVLESAFPAEIDTYLAWDLGRYNFSWHPIMIGVLAHLVLLGVGLAASFCFPPPPPEDRSMTLWGWLERGRRGARGEARGEAGQEVVLAQGQMDGGTR